MAHNTALIDRYGRLLALKLNPEGERLTLVMDVPLGTGDAPLICMGDWLGWYVWQVTSFLLFLNQLLEYRRRRWQRVNLL